MNKKKLFYNSEVRFFFENHQMISADTSKKSRFGNKLFQSIPSHIKSMYYRHAISPVTPNFFFALSERSNFFTFPDDTSGSNNYKNETKT